MKRRDEEDFRELGAYLQAAREALLKAEVKALNMYRQGAGPGRRIERQREQLDALRSHLDNTWLHDVRGGHVSGPEPFYGAHNHFEAVEDIGRQLGRVSREAEQYRASRKDWGAA